MTKVYTIHINETILKYLSMVISFFRVILYDCVYFLLNVIVCVGLFVIFVRL